MTKIYLDTNIWLDYVFNRGTLSFQSGLISHQILKRVVGCEFYIVISDVVKKELDKHMNDPTKLFDILSPKCIFVQTSQADIEKAKNVAIHYPDTVHLAIAEREQCDYFVTNDSGFFSIT